MGESNKTTKSKVMSIIKVDMKNRKLLKRISVEITEDQKSFLTDKVIFEDAATNLSEAVQWCIDACMKIEKLYGIDACYVGYNDIRLKENQP